MIWALLSLALGAGAAAGDLRAAAGRADITPDLNRKVWLAGYGAAGRRAKAVRDPLHARALVVSDGRKTVAVVAVDLLGLFHADARAVRARLGWNGGKKYLLLTATHNHSGPDTLGMWGPVLGVSGVDADYRERLIATIASLVEDLEKKMEPATARFGTLRLDPKDLCRDRRDPVVIDPELSALRLLRRDGSVLATAARFSCHPEVLTRDNDAVTADFPGALCADLERDGGTCVFLPGAIGGLMTPDTDRSAPVERQFARKDALGRALAAWTREALAGARPVSGGVDFSTAAVRFPVENSRYLLFLRNLSFGHELSDAQGRPLSRGQALRLSLRHLLRFPLPAWRRPFVSSELSLVSLAGVKLLGIPGELFPESALGGYGGEFKFHHPLVGPSNEKPPRLDAAPGGPFLRELLPKDAVIVGLANDELGYFVPAYDFAVAPTRSMAPRPPGTHYEETNSLGLSAEGILVEAAARLAAPGRAPGFRRRGALEGFYGRPWTWEQRGAMVSFLASKGMNLFVLAAKDEPSQRERWREPFSREEAAALRALAARAKRAGVTLAWTLSPGRGFSGDEASVSAAAAKLSAAAAAGVPALVIAFDDTPPRRGHAAFANEVRRRVSAAHPAVLWSFVPAVYWGREPSGLEGLDPAFAVGWTGPQIISRRIVREDARLFDGRKLLLGDNYPVQDRLDDSGPLFLGPPLGRDPWLADGLEGYLANASPLAEASRLPLAAAAAFARDPRGFAADPWGVWRREAMALGGRPLLLLARECARSWLLPLGDAPGSMAEKLSAGKPDKASLRELAALPKRADALEPWAAKLRILSRAALAKLDGREAEARLLRTQADGNPAVVSGYAFERWLDGLAPIGSGALSVELAAGRGERLNPWPSILARAARRGRKPGLMDRMRDRWALLPLLAAKAAVDEELARAERRWDPSIPARPMSWALRPWRPDLSPDRLRAERDRLMRGSRLPESGPWIRKIGDAADLLELARRPQKPGEWDRLRMRLRSGNGLEAVLELKQRLESPADPTLPENPADLL